ncbi:MAG TPA: helix-hairpin-helix domain-containing protein [Rubricoccaceae bacterium]|jgi:competence protein ComEA
MPWLYRLQTRAGLTGPEGTAAVVLVLALAGGLTAQRVQAAATPVAPDFYAAADAAFIAADRPDAPAEAPAGVLHLAAMTAVLPDTTRADSLAADTLLAEASGETWAPESAPAEADAAVASSARRSSGRKPPPVRTNLNTASSDELQRLPRIGPALAGRIIEYRRVHGRFRSAAELTEVRGIGDRTMERLAPWVHI